MALPRGVDVLPSGKFRARLTHGGTKHHTVWDTQRQAEAWLKRTRREMALGTFTDGPDEPDTDQGTGAPEPPLLGDYADTWLAERPLKPRSREHYARLLPTLAPLAGTRVDLITVAAVNTWYAGTADMPATMRAHTYGLLRTILNSAWRADLIAANPCRISGAGQARRQSRTTVPTPVQVHALADAMPTAKYKVMVLLAAWCGLRFGELVELRPGDFTATTITVSRAVALVGGEHLIGEPKSEAGSRTVVIPPHIRPEVQAHVAGVAPGALLFPAAGGGHMRPSTLYKVFYPARTEVGLPALRWHDLRHFSGTTAAQTGATLAELMEFLGHGTTGAAMKYQHAAAGSGERIAEAMSATVTPIRGPRKAPRRGRAG